MRISEHFTFEEMVRSATAKRRKIDNTPTATEIGHLIYLVTNVLEPARRAANVPFIITSGYRSKELNKAVGGCRNSYHLYGMAADIHADNVPQAYAIAKILLQQAATDVAIVENRHGKVWVHVQTSVRPRHKLLTINN